MPVRVKCRCGQELVLRYGEWVYFLLGLVLLCLVVNSAALLLLYFRLDEAASTARRVGPAEGLARPAAPAPDPRRVPEVPGGGGESERGADGDAGGDDGAGGAGLPAATSVEGAPPGARPADSAGEVQPPPPPPDESRPPASALEAGAPRREDPDVATLLSALPPWREGAPDGAARVEDLPLVPAAPWSREAAVVRFLVLERAPAEGLIRHAFLLDPDRRLRRAAADRIRSLPLEAGEDARLARRVLEAAAPYLEGEPHRSAVLRAHGLEPDAAIGAAAGPDIEQILGSLGRGAESVLSEPALASVRALAGRVAERGMDIVLLIDVSRSMEGALEPLQHDSLWLFPAIGWAFPGARIGIALYRDDVESARGLAGADSEELVRVLREARAEGGGDVPEGVHRAVEEALSLGRFAWRPAAEKHIFVIGDAPPPYPEQARLISLAARAFREGGYRVHALSVRPDEDRPAVPSFPEIAGSAGGTAVTVTEPERLGEEVFWRLFPPEALAALRPLGGRLRSLFSSAGA